MAEPIETEYRFKVDEAIRELQKLRRELGEVGDATEESGSAADKAEGQWGSFSSQVTAGILVFREVADAISGAVESIREFGLEFERQAGIMNRFSGDVSLATERTNGLFRSIDLMVAQQRALQAGLNLSAEEFSTLAVAANESASALGTDNVQSLNRLIQAMATGRSGALREFGIDIRGITEAAEIQSTVMGELSGRYGDVESSADTLGGQFIVLENRVEDAKTQFFEIMSASKEAENAFDSMWKKINEVFGGGPSSADDIIRTFASLVEGALAGLATTAGGIAESFGMLGEAFDLLMDGEFTAAANKFSAAARRFDMAFIEGAESGADAAVSTFAQGAPDRARPPRPPLPPPPPPPPPGPATARLRQSAAIFGAQVGGLGDERDALGSFGAGLVGEFGDMDTELEVFGERAENVFRQADKDIERLIGTTRDFGDVLGDVGSEMTTLSDVSSALWQVFEEGPERALQSFLRATGQRNALLALEELAKAAGSYPDFVGIEQHLQAAALHAAVAAAAGAGSAAIGSGGGAAAARPARPANDNTEGGGTTVINVHYNSRVPESQIGREQRRAERATARRFGAVRGAA